MFNVSVKGCSSNFKSDLDVFLDGGKISKMGNILCADENRLFHIIGCYYGVVEGIDVFFDNKVKNEPRLFSLMSLIYYSIYNLINCEFSFSYFNFFRFRLRIKIGDESNEIDLLMCNEVVKSAAPLSCNKLIIEVSF
jgi:hypothetical protein